MSRKKSNIAFFFVLPAILRRSIPASDRQYQSAENHCIRARNRVPSGVDSPNSLYATMYPSPTWSRQVVGRVTHVCQGAEFLHGRTVSYASACSRTIWNIMDPDLFNSHGGNDAAINEDNAVTASRHGLCPVCISDFLSAAGRGDDRAGNAVDGGEITGGVEYR